MIDGATKTEATYRAIPLNSSSSLKDFSLDRKKYYRKYVLNEGVEEDDNKAATMGRLVETLLLEPEEFDKRFTMSIVESAPTGLMLEFVEALYRHTRDATSEDGEVNKEFEELVDLAYVDSGFKIKKDAVLNKFIGSDAELYYKEIREVRSRNLTVVTVNDVTNAEKIVEELRSNFATSDIVNKSGSGVYNQIQVDDFEIDGLKLKSMIDKIVVNDLKKTVQVYDLKCVWAVENFFEEYYLYRRAYIQAYVYYHAAKAKFPTYTINPPKFIVCDSTNYFNPLVYELTFDDLDDAYNGFEYKGRKYPGVKQIIEDLKWAFETTIWNISKDNYENDGYVKLRK